MSGFTGIVLFNDKFTQELQQFNFPVVTNIYFQKIHEINEVDFALSLYRNKKKTYTGFFTYSDRDVMVGLDGVNTNSLQASDITTDTTFKQFVAESSGSFSAFHLNCKLKKLILFADQTSSRQLFYYHSKDFVAFSSSIFLLVQIIKHFRQSYSLSMPASYMMLSLGYLLEDNTLVNEIKKVTAGSFVTIQYDGVSKTKYHSYYSEIMHNNITKDLIQELDFEFHNSLMYEYDLDRHNDYKHIATLSGGLDSRLNVMLAYKLGYNDITCLTFSEGYKSDELIAREISSSLSLKHIILILNNGFQLFDICTPLTLNNCSVVYYGASQTLEAVKKFNFSDYGLFHNGSLAESSKGGYLNAPYHQLPSLQKHYAVSDKLFNRIGDDLIKNILQSYPNDEMFVTYNRGFNAIHNGIWMTLPFAESVYTYMDPGFARLAYSVHPKLRYNGYLTIEWLKALHPELLQYKWKYGINPTNSKVNLFAAKAFYKIKRILKEDIDIPVPIEYWYEKNPVLREFIENEKKRDSISINHLFSRELNVDIEKLFSEGNVREKLLCLSFIKSVKLLFNN